MADVRGRRVLVTGTADGLGAATAVALDARGARVALVGPGAGAGSVVAAGGSITVVDADLRDIDSLGRAVDAVVEKFGGLDAVVAAAAVPGDGTVAETDPADFARTIDVNVLGTYRIMRLTTPALKASRGYFLAVSGLAAFSPQPGHGAFSASRAAVESLADSLRFEAHGARLAVGVAYPASDADPRKTAVALADAVGSRPPRVYVAADAARQRWLRAARTSRLLTVGRRA